MVTCVPVVPWSIARTCLAFAMYPSPGGWCRIGAPYPTHGGGHGTSIGLTCGQYAVRAATPPLRRGPPRVLPCRLRPGGAHPAAAGACVPTGGPAARAGDHGGDDAPVEPRRAADDHAPGVPAPGGAPAPAPRGRRGVHRGPHGHVHAGA